MRIESLAVALATVVMREGYTAQEFRRFERRGVHATPVHFYQPIPDTSRLPDDIWNRMSELIGIDMNDDEQLRLVRDVFPQFRTKNRGSPECSRRGSHELLSGQRSLRWNRCAGPLLHAEAPPPAPDRRSWLRLFDPVGRTGSPR